MTATSKTLGNISFFCLLTAAAAGCAVQNEHLATESQKSENTNAFLNKFYQRRFHRFFFDFWPLGDRGVRPDVQFFAAKQENTTKPTVFEARATQNVRKRYVYKGFRKLEKCLQNRADTSGRDSVRQTFPCAFFYFVHFSKKCLPTYFTKGFPSWRRKQLTTRRHASAPAPAAVEAV